MKNVIKNLVKASKKLNKAREKYMRAVRDYEYALDNPRTPVYIEGETYMRLSKLSRELEMSYEDVVSFFRNSNYAIELNPSAKVGKQAYDFIIAQMENRPVEGDYPPEPDYPQ